MPESPEQIARRQIDTNLAAAGWVVQDGEDMDLTAGRGTAVREFAMASGYGFADYLLYLDRKALGAVEAKAEGTLSGVEAQSAKYAAGLPAGLPAHRRPLPFLFESNGAVTYFTNGRSCPAQPADIQLSAPGDSRRSPGPAIAVPGSAQAPSGT